MSLEEERLAPDDLIPRWRDGGLSTKLKEWAVSNYTISEIIGGGLMGHHSPPENATRAQFLQYIADVLLVGDTINAEFWGGVLPEAIPRQPAPASPGASVSAVWFGSEEYAVGKTFWFYVNKELRYTETGSNSISRDLLGVCQSGSKVQICEVLASVVGWWAEVQVP